jgi:F-type H+-transporting ATPase subunit gamma
MKIVAVAKYGLNERELKTTRVYVIGFLTLYEKDDVKVPEAKKKCLLIGVF